MATTARTAGEPRARTVRGRKFFANRDWVWLAVFLIPAFLVVVVLQFYPLAYSAFISVQDWRLTESQTPQGFIGLANFSSILTDPVFQRAVSNSALITGGGVLIELLLGFTLAFLTIGSSWTMRSIRTLLILPMVIAPVAAGTLFRMILNSRSGLLLVFLSWLHIASPEWLAAPAWARVSVTMLEIWQWTPFVLLVVAAGITAIPDEILEAASIDGAGRWQTLWRVQLPLLVPVLLLVVMFRILDSLLSLDAVYSLTAGGPGYSTYTLTFMTYTLGLKNFNLGEAAATSWIFMAFSSILIILMFWLHRRSER